MQTSLAIFVGWMLGVLMMLIHRDIVRPWQIERNKKRWAEWQKHFDETCPPPPARKQ